MVSAARLGKSVLLLDADPRNPSQHLFFQLQPKFGWEEILRNKRTFKKAICRIGKTSLYVYPNRILQNGGNLLGMVLNNRRYHIPEFVYKRL